MILLVIAKKRMLFSKHPFYFISITNINQKQGNTINDFDLASRFLNFDSFIYSEKSILACLT